MDEIIPLGVRVGNAKDPESPRESGLDGQSVSCLGRLLYARRKIRWAGTNIAAIHGKNTAEYAQKVTCCRAKGGSH